MNPSEPTQEEIDRLFNKLDSDAEASGYHLNPDEEFTKELVSGLLVNQKRYGYQACPCRLTEGDIDKDRDVICPCDYRDPDLSEFGACYCALYVDDDIKSGEKDVQPIPERRPIKVDREKKKDEVGSGSSVPLKVPMPVWRCTVCGYLAARPEPPLVCPICKAKKDRFEKFF